MHNRKDNDRTAVLVHNLSKSYPPRRKSDAETSIVFNQLNLTVSNNELLTVFGPNGCGKTTLLRILAGYDKEYTGEVSLYGKKPQQIEMGYVFQDFSNSLLPWRSALENIIFPLELKGMNRKEHNQKVDDLISEMGLEKKIPPLLTARPYELSAGQQQLICILRAFVSSPELLLLDEPFSALDFETRFDMNNKLLNLWSTRHIPIVVVTHDLDEAMYVGSRLILLGPGSKGIMGDVELSYEEPRTPALLKSKQFLFRRAEILEIFLAGIKQCGND